MKHARVAYSGAIHRATPPARPSSGSERSSMLQLEDGRVLSEEEVVWLPPFEVGTVIALGLNYADHAKELAFGSQQEPLVFLKGPGALLGHRGATRRPAEVKYMHYECELAVIIGRTAKRVTHAEAMQHVAGYCIANDYAVRDYLENWYRPNMRAKNRDGATVLGPWFVDARCAAIRTCVRSPSRARRSPAIASSRRRASRNSRWNWAVKAPCWCCKTQIWKMQSMVP